MLLSIVVAVSSYVTFRIGVAAMAKRLTVGEQTLVDDIMKRQRLRPADALAAVKAKREREGATGPSKHTIYRYLNGDTHLRGRKEKRGRSRSVSRADLRTLMQTRRRLIKAAGNEYRVTYAGITDAASLEKEPCVRTVADALRNEGVRFKTPRRKVQLSKLDAKARLKQAKKWIKCSYQRYVGNVTLGKGNVVFLCWQNSKKEVLDNIACILIRVAPTRG